MIKTKKSLLDYCKYNKHNRYTVLLEVGENLRGRICTFVEQILPQFPPNQVQGTEYTGFSLLIFFRISFYLYSYIFSANNIQISTQ